MPKIVDNLRDKCSFQKFCCYFRLECGAITISVIECLVVVFVLIYELIPNGATSSDDHEHGYYTEKLDSIIIGVMCLISCGLMIYGVVKRNHFLLLPWMTGCFFLILILIALVFYTMFSSSDKLTLPLKFLIYFLLFLNVYFLYVIVLLYKIFSSEYQSKLNLLNIMPVSIQRASITPAVLNDVHIIR